MTDPLNNMENMMRSLGAGWTRLLLVMLAACPLLAMAAAGERPKIAVVLSGGGAKGSAHIGILKVLEQKRIPVDIIVGTSMGSYVAGMYAMGLSAEEVERMTLAIDWNKGYQDKVGRDELSLRKKQQNEQYQLRTDIGVNGDTTQLPDGFFQGQSMASLLRGRPPTCRCRRVSMICRSPTAPWRPTWRR